VRDDEAIKAALAVICLDGKESRHITFK